MQEQSPGASSALTMHLLTELALSLCKAADSFDVHRQHSHKSIPTERVLQLLTSNLNLWPEILDRVKV